MRQLCLLRSKGASSVGVIGVSILWNDIDNIKSKVIITLISEINYQVVKRYECFHYVDRHPREITIKEITCTHVASPQHVFSSFKEDTRDIGIFVVDCQ